MRLTKMLLPIGNCAKHVNMAACMSENGSNGKLELYPFTTLKRNNTFKKVNYVNIL